MIERIKAFFSGSLEKGEHKKFAFLAAIFGITIGVYWLLRPIKDGLFLTMVGTEYVPLAKMLSVLIVVPIVMIYSKLVDMFPRHIVLYIVSLFYAALAVIFSLCILHPTVGIANTVADPSRLLGWAFYLYVETFGTIMAALFWAFVSDTTTPDSAKRGYGFIVMGAQTGAVLLPLTSKAIIVAMGKGGTAYALMFGVTILCLLPIMVYLYMRGIPRDLMEGFKAENKGPLEGGHKKAGFLEGLRLLVAKPYLLAIFGIVSFYEIINAVLDYQFKGFAKASYTGDALVVFLNDFAVLANFIGLVCILVGINRIGRILGFGKTLVILPLLIGACVLIMGFYPFLHVAFITMAVQKSFNYSLNQPVKEQLYIPTTKDTKYKAKAWIDMFGSRGSKASGSLINFIKIYAPSAFPLIFISSSLALCFIWFMISAFLGKTYEKAVEKNEVVC